MSLKIKKHLEAKWEITRAFTIIILGYKVGHFFRNKIFKRRDSRSPNIDIEIPRDYHHMEQFERFQRTQDIPELIYKRILKRSRKETDIPEFFYKRIL